MQYSTFEAIRTHNHKILYENTHFLNFSVVAPCLFQILARTLHYHNNQANSPLWTGSESTLFAI